MKIILDTNVLASGIFFESGLPGKIVIAFIEEKFELIISPEILDEYIEIVTRLQANFPKVNIDKFLDKIFRLPAMCIAEKLPEPVSQDPDDDKFIACAIASKTKIIVSGDKHLLDVSGYKGVEILTPRQFFEKYLK